VLVKKKKDGKGVRSGSRLARPGIPSPPEKKKKKKKKRHGQGKPSMEGEVFGERRTFPSGSWASKSWCPSGGGLTREGGGGVSRRKTFFGALKALWKQEKWRRIAEEARILGEGTAFYSVGPAGSSCHEKRCGLTREAPKGSLPQGALRTPQRYSSRGGGTEMQKCLTLKYAVWHNPQRLSISEKGRGKKKNLHEGLATRPILKRSRKKGEKDGRDRQQGKEAKS